MFALPRPSLQNCSLALFSPVEILTYLKVMPSRPPSESLPFFCPLPSRSRLESLLSFASFRKLASAPCPSFESLLSFKKFALLCPPSSFRKFARFWPLSSYAFLEKACPLLESSPTSALPPSFAPCPLLPFFRKFALFPCLL